MSRIIDSLKYPTTFDEMRRDKAFTKYWLTVAPTKSKVVFAFLMAPTRGASIYTKHMAPNAPSPLPIDPLTHKMASAILKDGGSDDPKLWNAIRDRVVKTVTEHFEDVDIEGYITSNVFKKYHQTQVEELATRKFGTANEVIKRLNFKSGSSTMVHALLLAMAVGDKSNMTKYGKAVMTNEGLSSSLKDLVGAIANTKPLQDAAASKVDASAKKLTACGFENAADAKLRAAVADLAQAVASGDDKNSAVLVKKVKKLEPKTSQAGQADLKALAKAFIKQKVIL